MKTLADLSKSSYANHVTVGEHDLVPLRRQYMELLSCFRGLSVQVDAARFMYEKMGNLFSFIIEHLTEIIDHTQAFAVRPNDSRSCMLLLEYELSQLLYNSTTVFDEFYVPKLYSVLKDFENQDFCYDGYRFSPSCTVIQDSAVFLNQALKIAPLVSINMFDLLTEKTSRIVDCCNNAWASRQYFAEAFVERLEHYLTVRSELRGLSRSVSLPVKASHYKAVVCTKMQMILRGLRTDSDEWMHDSFNNLFM